MQLATIWQQVQRVQEAIRQGSCETQDTTIAVLQDTLATGPPSLFPSFVHPLLTDVLHFYCRDVLPNLGISAEDQHIVRKEFERTITHLNTQEHTAKHLEAQLKQFFLKVKSGTFNTVEEIITTLSEIVAVIPPLRGVGGCIPRQTTVCLGRVRGGSIPLLGGVRGGFLKEVEKSYRTFQKSPFTAKYVIPFFNTLLHDALPQNIREPIASIHDLFRHQLHELVHMKAVLVNTKTKDALITRLDVTTSLESKGLGELIFENTVDDRMYNSCWNAVQAARAFLEEHFPDTLKNRSLHVSCRFPNPIAGYNDTSASLLVSLKVIGHMLDMEIDPHTVVSGEVDESGKILPVACLAEKVLAARQHPEIQRVLLPADGLLMPGAQMEIIGVRELSEAVAYYYGESYRQKLKQSRRRQELGRVVSIVKNLFITLPNPVTDSDRFLIDRAKRGYQEKGEYQDAIEMFDVLVKRFQREDSVTEALQLKAEALGYLGVIYTEQHQFSKSLQVLRDALNIWRAIRDHKQCANTLLRIGSVHRYALLDDGNPSRWRSSLQCYQQAHALMRRSRQQFSDLQTKYDRMVGYLYYWSEDYALAEEHSRRSMEGSNGHDSVYHQWNYHTAQQHVGRVLMKQGEYDRAYDMLTCTASADILQTPHNQARSCWTLSEFFLLREDIEQGVEYARKADKLCRTYGLTAEQQMLTKLLAQHNLSSWRTHDE